jgi:hypothetical protein
MNSTIPMIATRSASLAIPAVNTRQFSTTSKGAASFKHHYPLLMLSLPVIPTSTAAAPFIATAAVHSSLPKDASCVGMHERLNRSLTGLVTLDSVHNLYFNV